MAIGLGIVLLAAGLILLLDVVNVDLSFVNDQALGWVLLVGVLALVLSLVVNQQRTKHTVVEERR